MRGIRFASVGAQIRGMRRLLDHLQFSVHKFQERRKACPGAFVLPISGDGSLVLPREPCLHLSPVLFAARHIDRGSYYGECLLFRHARD